MTQLLEEALKTTYKELKTLRSNSSNDIENLEKGFNYVNDELEISKDKSDVRTLLKLYEIIPDYDKDSPFNEYQAMSLIILCTFKNLCGENLRD